jgi:hypothetical protein
VGKSNGNRPYKKPPPVSDLPPSVRPQEETKQAEFMMANDLR